jgi:hypothetical protein
MTGGHDVIEVPGEHTESPSLAEPAGDRGPAYELKFLLDEARAREAEAWAAARLGPDPHGDPALGGAYRTTTLYLDTPALDVFHRMPSFRRSKHRLRRYGAEPRVFLERKAKDGDRVRKWRTAVPEGELALLAGPLAESAWPGQWFHRRLHERGLRPAALIVYERTAYVGAGAEGPMRLTVDRRLHGTTAGAWAVPAGAGGVPLLTDRAILELKFRLALPAPFKELVQTLRLNPGPLSKYRSCMTACGVPNGRGDAPHA